jgi:hypothetical protein
MYEVGVWWIEEVVLMAYEIGSSNARARAQEKKL